MKQVDPQTQAAIELLSQIQKLLQLHEENPFKIRAFDKAQDSLVEVCDLPQRAKAGTLTEIKGIGKGISEVLTEFFELGKSSVKEELESSLPEGLLELVGIRGLGVKKAKLLMEQLEIKSVGELEYACHENRLLKIKGFGEKVQSKILSEIQFIKSTQGKVRIDDALVISQQVLELLKSKLPAKVKVSETGELRRKKEVLSRLDFMIEVSKTHQKMIETKVLKALSDYRKKVDLTVEVGVSYAEPDCWGYELAKTTASAEHWKALGEPKRKKSKTEEEFYQELGLKTLPPETRETGEEVTLVKKNKLPKIIVEDQVQGVFHNHTTYSDGIATLEQMVKRSMELGYRYIGISDHSQSAFYAQGLKTPELKQQQEEVKKIQKKYPKIKIFWGVESDILADGSLDYTESQLKKFDFVIASIHSRFQMNKEEMTQRMIQAIRHPATRMIGHLTGRLLLGRAGYELDFEKIISEASKNQVAIEINAHPARLDIDWRLGKLLRKYKTMVSINPDAHSLEGLEDTSYGVITARKALLPQELVLNTFSTQEVENWLQRK